MAAILSRPQYVKSHSSEKNFTIYSRRVITLYRKYVDLPQIACLNLARWPIKRLNMSQLPAVRENTQTKSFYDANFVVTGCTAGGHNDNPLCHQWRQNYQYEDPRF